MADNGLHLSGIHDCGGIAHDAMKIGWAIDHLKEQLKQAGELRINLKVERRFRNKDSQQYQTEQVLYDTELIEPDDGDHSKVVELIIAALVEHKLQLEADLKIRLQLSGLNIKE